MAQLLFTPKDTNKTFSAYLVIGFMDDNGQEEEKEMAFGGGEDLQSYMKAILKKEYDWFFAPDELRVLRITDCWIKGVSFSAKSEEGKMAVHVTDDYVHATCIVNDEVLQDANAQKIKDIQAIIRS